ncbi:hypothetical protein K7X08_012566 [Anisodus acutangulus]|uniref:Leucine-rich repeat-containing N-terminal plant-type domain-containing protein n=1 Tax=Anisodus acutangulus TaxID=402998 RepID=A0A9Q1R0H2_9SOLA|nr:hypothetical protein K7X08_012566 [Anisodus acutangulus]
MRSQLLLLILLVVVSIMKDVVEAKCLEDQKMQLLQLRNDGTYDPELSTKLQYWDERIDCCEWRGVSCNGSGQVIGLNLTDAWFSGSINALSDLKFLSVIILDFNNLSAAPFSRLLRRLIQSNCLESMLLQLNRRNTSEDIPGPLPSSMSNLTQLVYLDLFVNRFTASLFSLPSLDILDLSRNKFSGQITDQLQNVNSPLTKIDLSANNLEGPLPEFLFELKHVIKLSLSSNNFSATVKLDKFTKLQNLIDLDLSGSGLSVDANISQSDLAFLPQLHSLKLASCNLQNNISFLKNQYSLEVLDLSDNHIKGEIPNWIWGIAENSQCSESIS